MVTFARALIVVGVVLVLAGGAILAAAKLGIPLGRLPGDIRWQSGNATCVIALGTSILLSILLTVLLNVLVRFLNK